MRRYRISVALGLALLYTLALSPHQTASADACPGPDQVIKPPAGSSVVSFRVLGDAAPTPSPAPDVECDRSGADTGWNGSYYGSGTDGSGTDPRWNGDRYESGSLPFTGPGHNVIFAVEIGVAAILLGTFLILLSMRADRSRRISRIAGR